MDLPGHGTRGEVTGGGVTLSHALAVVDEVTAGLDRFDLIGYSMGGRVALHVALARGDRIRRLVLESASPGLERKAERAERIALDEELAARIERGGVAAFVDTWSSRPLFASQKALPVEIRERLRGLRLENRATGLAASLRGLGTGVLPSLWDRLGELRCPVLLVVGALDTKFVYTARAMAPHIPDGRLSVIGGVGHTVHLEAPHAWLDAVGPFLIAQDRASDTSSTKPGTNRA